MPCSRQNPNKNSNRSGNVPLSPHIAEPHPTAQHLGGASSTTSGLEEDDKDATNVRTLRGHTAQQKLLVEQGGLDLIIAEPGTGLDNLPGREVLIGRDQDRLKESQDPEDSSPKTERAKRKCVRDLQDLGKWSIKETPTSRNGRTTRRSRSSALSKAGFVPSVPKSNKTQISRAYSGIPDHVLKTTLINRDTPGADVKKVERARKALNDFHKRLEQEDLHNKAPESASNKTSSARSLDSTTECESARGLKDYKQIGKADSSLQEDLELEDNIFAGRRTSHRTSHLQDSLPIDIKVKRIGSRDCDTEKSLPEKVIPLPENTICITSFLSDEDFRILMPDKDDAVLTRARRRADGPVEASTANDRVSKAHPGSTGERRYSFTNGIKKLNRSKSPSSANRGVHGLDRKRTTSSIVDVDHTTRVKRARASGLELDDPPRRKRDEKPLERNIDNVIFGRVSFKAWYPSWYPKEIIGEKGLAGDAKGIVVGELYVCDKCFAYSKTPVEWVRHTRCCEKDVPGEKIYTHGGDAHWSIWEVDGDIDTLFCQNLSLFAKLFLDNKSVFFDVSGFKYFLLVHSQQTAPPASADPQSPSTVQNRVIGFFSKEKMSWDNNNLACILIFPPWQKKSLGNLLMGISYAISRREKVLGGPEKPISDLGRKGYKRFWGGEIARWLLDRTESDKKGGGIITVADLSRETWIVADDCLNVLREMDVVQKVDGGEEEVVVLDKEKVRAWVARSNINLDRVVDEDGFVEGYAIVEDDAESQDVDMLEE